MECIATSGSRDRAASIPFDSSKKAVIWFRRAYRAAWLLFKEVGSARFPAGTLKMHHGYQQEREDDSGCFDWCVRMRAAA